MNILFILNETVPFGFGGMENYAFHLAKAYSRKGHRVSFLSSVDNDGKKFSVNNFNYDGIDIWAINHKSIRARAESVRFLFGLQYAYFNSRIDHETANVLAKIKPDIVHIHGLANLSASIVDLVKNEGIPVVMTLHDYWPVCGNGSLFGKDMTRHLPSACSHECLIHPLDKMLLGIGLNPARSLSKIPYYLFRRYILLRKRFFDCEVMKKKRVLLDTMLKSDILIAPSKFLREIYVSAGVPDEKIFYYDNGFETENMTGGRRKKNKNKKNRKIFGYAGKITPEKGLHILIEAFNKIRGNASLYIYGKAGDRFLSYERYLKNLAKNNPRIDFRGRVDNPQSQGARNFYAEMDALIVPSIWWENSPLVIHEAFLSRTPVITSDIGGMKEYVSDKKNGLLFQTGNVVDLRNKIQLLIDDPLLLEKITPDPGTVKTIEENAAELMGIYNSLLKHQ